MQKVHHEDFAWTYFLDPRPTDFLEDVLCEVLDLAKYILLKTAGYLGFLWIKSTAHPSNREASG